MAHSRAHDYDAEETLVVSGPAQLQALGDATRSRIVALLRTRAASATELARRLELPKGTVGYHLKVLERAGLVHVVRTRRVRAVTEKLYGRVARLFLIQSDDEGDQQLVHRFGALSLKQAAAELAATPEVAMHALLRVRLDPPSLRRFNKRLDRLVQDVRDAESPAGDFWGVAVALYRLEEDA